MGLQTLDWLFQYLAPLTLHGNGSYALSALKEMVATGDFLDLDDKTKSCQNVEPYEHCTTRIFNAAMKEKCGCIPFRLRNFSDSNEVKIKILLSTFKRGFQIKRRCSYLGGQNSSIKGCIRN